MMFSTTTIPHVDDGADGQSDSAQRHHVDRETGERKSQGADQDRQEDHRTMMTEGRNRRKNAATTKRHQQCAQPDFVDEFRMALRMYVDWSLTSVTSRASSGISPRSFMRGFLRDAFADPIDDRDGVFTRFAQQRAVDAAVAVDADDVVLNGGIVLGIADVADEDRAAVANGDRIVDVFGRRQGVDRVHLVFRIAEFHRAGGQHQVRVAQGVDDVGGAQAERLQLPGST
jgi:hypothetical protein